MNSFNHVIIYEMSFFKFLSLSLQFKYQFSLLPAVTNSIQIPAHKFFNSEFFFTLDRTFRPLTLNIQEHAFLMSTDSAESLTVKTSPVR